MSPPPSAPTETVPEVPLPWRRTLVLGGLGAAAALLAELASRDPETVERIYSQGFYPQVAAVLGAVAGFFPFSLGETLLFGVAVAGLRGVGRGILAGLRRRGRWRNLLARACLLTFGWSALGYALFVLLWGLNYSRLPVHRLLSLDVHPVSLEVLQATARYLIEEADRLREALPEDEAGVLASPDGRNGVVAKLPVALGRAASELPWMAGLEPVVRFPLLSAVMGWVGISGIYWPFTAEPHVHAKLPTPELPFTLCHEVAHLRGFAREDAASFLAFRVCELSGEPLYRYSGTLMASIHALGALARQDPALAEVLAERRSAAVRRDLAALNDFWAPRSSLVRWARRGGSTVNDAFLQANRDPRGVASYGAMADLLVAYLRPRLDPPRPVRTGQGAALKR